MFRTIVALNCSFHSVENTQFQKLVGMLKPGAIVPDRKKLAGPLLDEIYEDELTKVKSHVKGLPVTMAIDGWSTIMNDPVIGVCFYAAGKCYLLETVDTTGENHNTAYTTEIALKFKRQIEADFEVSVIGLVTDNAANMNAMRTEVKRECPKLSVYGCQAHIVNLLVKDIINLPEFKSCSSKVVSVLKYLRNTHAASAELKKHNMPRPSLPCDTRWNSAIESFEYFVVHWSTIAEIINSSGLRRHDAIYRYMEEIQLKRSANDAIDFLKPIGASLDKLQRNDCCLGEAYEIWQSIGLNTPEEYVEILEKRRKMAVTPVMLAANLLDHRYCGSNMSPIEVQEALAYIASVDDTCLADVTKFMARHTPYNEKLFEGSFADVSSSTWWKSGGKLGFDPNLISCAISIVSSVSSSGGLERQFSTLGMNYGKLRSHLGVEKAGKLAFLYRQLNNKD